MKVTTSRQMHEVDARATSMYAIPSIILMEHAATGVYDSLIKDIDKKTKVCIVCGSGNNGGDGFALARLLHIQNYTVSIYFIGNKDKLTTDAKINYDTCISLHVPFVDTLIDCDLYIDCIFGTGLSRNIEGKYKDVIDQMNASKTKIYAVDIASGIDSDTGKIYGTCIKADKTYTFVSGKIGMYIYPGRLYSGTIEVIDIFMPKDLLDICESTIYVIEKDNMQDFLPTRSMHSNKGSYGRVATIGGSKNMTGAIIMASRAALKAGCGLLTCYVPSCIQQVVQNHIYESMSFPLQDKDGILSKDNVSILQDKLSSSTTILIGCGITREEDIKDIVQCVYDLDKDLVVDADGIFVLKDVIYNRKNVVLTPHMKEFSTLMHVSVQDVVNNPLYYVDMFTAKYPDITLVLKSETTIIAKGEVRYINTYGNNGLATGGSGDVLAGLITGLLAQNKDPLKAAVLGVFLHAYASDILHERKSTYSILPSDIIEEVESILKTLEERL